MTQGKALLAGLDQTTHDQRLTTAEQALCDVCGVKTIEVARRLMSELVHLQHAEAPQSDADELVKSIALLAKLQPTNATEALLSVQMIGVHQGRFRFLRQRSGCSGLGGSAQGFSASREHRFGVGGAHDDSLDMFAEVGFATHGAHLGEKRLDLAERRENLTVGGAKCIGINGAGRHQRRRQIPVAQHHAERGVPLATHERDELGEALWVEVSEEPAARLAQHWLSAQIEQLEVELRALKWCRHGAVIQFVNDVPRDPIASRSQPPSKPATTETITRLGPAIEQSAWNREVVMCPQRMSPWRRPMDCRRRAT
jgi:hypothetical protein